LERERIIRQKADELGALTKMEQRELVDFLEDRTVLNKVKGVLKFAETETAKDIRKALERDKEALTEEMDMLKDLRNISQSIQEASKKNVDPTELKRLTDEYMTELNRLEAHNVLKHQKDNVELKELLGQKLLDIDEQIAK